ncbi:MAG: NADH-quinone oxidoreductase subunit N [Prevotella sp.]|nr:NADH-quinone oxidoreductase subunit N [Prevotella sp.]
MNYGQFLNMIPEAFLVLALILVFLGDLCLSKSERKNDVLSKMTAALLLCLLCLTSTVGGVVAFGGMYVATKAAVVMKMILTLGTLIVVIMAQPWLERGNQVVGGQPRKSKYSGEFYELVLSTLLGMFMMTSSGHFLMFFLGLEMASVPMACLVAFDKWKRSSAEAAAKYVLTATFSSGVMLYGISFIYGAVGTLYFGDVANSLVYFSQYESHLSMLLMGLVFFFSGLGFKLSLVPFHFWTADTYEGAPTAVTGYLSVVSKGAAAFALMVILTKVFAPLVAYWDYLLYIVIVLSITIANLFAIRQSELKRFMAFSSISQAGYIMLAVIGASQAGMASLMYYVLVYVVANMAVFTVISAVEHSQSSPEAHGPHLSHESHLSHEAYESHLSQLTRMSAYNGLYQTNPKLAFLMTLALFSLAGIPPFAGMFSKFFVFMAAAQQGSFWAYFVVFIALVNTVVSLYYYLLIVKAMYITSEDHPLPTFRLDGATKVSLAVCTLGIVLFGICSCVYDYLFAASAI